ncbi:MAG: L-seryl-tRNA(Sec) selenium transferase, partial [Deltaproteobacteria bacterium]|nr:L-seryl-tRNA(Sec) selenium transferase [Deltaproteobacteria bacterium]
MVKELLRALPSIDETVRDRSVKDEAGEMAHELLVSVVRSVIEGFRRKILDGEHSAALSKEVVCKEVVERLRSLKSPSLKRVVNATGTVLHTNLGRAVISKEAISSLQELSNGFINLEYDLSTTGRGERDSHIEELLKILTGAEAVCVVNNNAAAVLIALNTLADNKEVVISRGELVEIGGSFRLPDVIEKSGCILKEVGTTNRTHLDDYRNAVGDNTAVLLKAHRSNFSIQGFTSEVSLKELVTLGEERDIPVVEDLGSGSLIDLSAFGMAKEPIVAQRLSSGADVVTFSGDKLLGGPQAGLIVGKKKYIDRIKKNPLKRALRVGKLTISTLEATLRAYLEPGNVS